MALHDLELVAHEFTLALKKSSYHIVLSNKIAGTWDLACGQKVGVNWLIATGPVARHKLCPHCKEWLNDNGS